MRASAVNAGVDGVRSNMLILLVKIQVSENWVKNIRNYSEDDWRDLIEDSVKNYGKIVGMELISISDKDTK